MGIGIGFWATLGVPGVANCQGYVKPIGSIPEKLEILISKLETNPNGPKSNGEEPIPWDAAWFRIL
jgi:hypothetical protein